MSQSVIPAEASHELLAFDNVVIGDHVPKGGIDKLEMIYECLEKDFTVKSCIIKWGEKLIFTLLHYMKRKGFPYCERWFIALSKGRSIPFRYKGISAGCENQLRVDFKFWASKIARKGLIPTMDRRSPSLISREYWGFLEEGGPGEIHPHISDAIKQTPEWNRYITRVRMKAEREDRTVKAYNNVKKLACAANNLKISKDFLNALIIKKKKYFEELFGNISKEQTMIIGEKIKEINKKIVKTEKRIGKISGIEVKKRRSGGSILAVSLTNKPEIKPYSETHDLILNPTYTPESQKYKEALMKESSVSMLDKVRANILTHVKSVISSKVAELKKGEVEVEEHFNKRKIEAKGSEKKSVRKKYVFKSDPEYKVILANKYKILGQAEEKINSILEEIDPRKEKIVSQVDFDYMEKVYDFSQSGRRKFSKRQKLSRKAALYHSCGYSFPKFGSVEKFVKGSQKKEMIFDMSAVESTISDLMRQASICEPKNRAVEKVSEGQWVAKEKSAGLKQFRSDLFLAYRFYEYRKLTVLGNNRPKKRPRTGPHHSDNVKMPLPDPIQPLMINYGSKLVREVFGEQFKCKAVSDINYKLLDHANVKEHVKMLKEKFEMHLDPDVEYELYHMIIGTRGVTFGRFEINKSYRLKMIKKIHSLKASALKGRLVSQALMGKRNLISTTPEALYEYLLKDDFTYT